MPLHNTLGEHKQRVQQDSLIGRKNQSEAISKDIIELTKMPLQSPIQAFHSNS